MVQHKKSRDNVHGILLLDKPTGLTANEALQKVKHRFNANKAGHTGALDPLATGMLPICFGEATKFSHYLLVSDKRYLVTAKLGVRTDTSDSEGQVIQTRPVLTSLAEITKNLHLFRGTIKQIPTMFSALKYQSKPLYHYARQGLTVPRVAREITVYELKLLRFEQDELTLEIFCSKGTYIRTIIDDLGERLGCGAHVIALRRLQVANFLQDEMVTFAQLFDEVGDNSRLMSWLLPLDTALHSLAKVMLNAQQSQQILTGRSIVLPVNHGQLVRLYIDQGNNHQRFIGIGLGQAGRLLPKRLIAH